MQEKINYKFHNLNLKEQALTHKSFYFESKSQTKAHNERLEFLGDAIIDLSLSILLMDKFKIDSEGDLSKKRASLVNETVLSEIALELGLDKLLKLGKGEKKTGGESKPRLLASAYEALVGAVYLDSNFNTSCDFVSKHFLNRIDAMSPQESYQHDFKTRLQEITQAESKETPIYKLLDESGPSHNKKFKIGLFVRSKKLAVGEGKSKKQAEQMAAKIAIEKMATENSVKPAIKRKRKKQ